MGKGRWDAGTLAEELECSRRTVYRLLQTLSLAGVPWYFDETARAYRVRPGFRFPDIEHALRASACFFATSNRSANDPQSGSLVEHPARPRLESEQMAFCRRRGVSAAT